MLDETHHSTLGLSATALAGAGVHVASVARRMVDGDGTRWIATIHASTHRCHDEDALACSCLLGRDTARCTIWRGGELVGAGQWSRGVISLERGTAPSHVLEELGGGLWSQMSSGWRV